VPGSPDGSATLDVVAGEAGAPYDTGRFDIGSAADGGTGDVQLDTASERSDVQPDVPIEPDGSTGGGGGSGGGTGGRSGTGGAVGGSDGGGPGSGTGGRGGSGAGTGGSGSGTGGSGGGTGGSGSGTGGSGSGTGGSGSGTGGSGTGGSGTGGQDPCSPNPCQHGSCGRNGASYTCDCSGTGYQGTNCEVDVNECATNNGGCDPLTSCTNTAGSRTCGACPSGYNGTGATGCTDINECATNNGGCDPLTTCTNTPPGSRTCGACPSGYNGTGATGCTDINECATNNGGCDPLTSCTNTPGSRNCGPCPAGYSGTGATGCVNINDCSPNPCRNGGTCTDLVASYSCSCVPPWSGSTCGSGTLVVDATARGTYGSVTWIVPLTGTTIAGYIASDLAYRAYFVFPIPNFTGTVSSVTLKLEIERYDSPDASEWINIYDVSTPIATLTQLWNTGQDWSSVFTDLGSGTQYGTFTVDTNAVGTVKTATLTPAITPVSNARGTSFAVGAAIGTYGGASEYARFSSDVEQRTHRLEIAVTP
jgi:hypothetical protein